MRYPNTPICPLVRVGAVVGLQCLEKGLQIRGQGRVKHHFLAGDRMLEPEFGGMQRLASEAGDDGGKILGQPVHLGGVSRRINGIGNQRMADIGHVNADLVGASRFQLAVGG